MYRKGVFIIPNLKEGGAERVLVNILKYTSSKSYEKVLVVYEKKGELFQEVPQNVKIISLERYHREGMGWAFLRLRNLIRIFIREKPDFILSFMTEMNLMAIIAAIISGHKNNLIISERTYTKFNILYADWGIFRKFIVAYLPKILYRMTRKIIAVSNDVATHINRYFGINRKKIVTIYNPLDIEKIKFSSLEDVNDTWFNPEEPIIISVGRLCKAKNFGCLIRAFHIVRKSIRCRLIILGEGEERAQLESLINRLGIGDNVVLPGFQRNPYKYIKRATVFVLSSLYEGFPNVLSEALACGTPIISTDCHAGPREILDNGKFGLLAPVNDENKLAEAIIKLLKDEEVQRHFSSIGQERTKDFDVKKIVKEYENVFDEVLKY